MEMIILVSRASGVHMLMDCVENLS